MKKVVILFLLIISVSSVFAWRDNEMEIRVFYNNDYELKKIIDLQPEGDIYPNGEALIYLIQSEFAALKATGLKYRIEKEDVKTYAENFWASMDNTREAYHTYADIVALADSLVTAFPNICEKHLFGTSVQGRELGALKISDNVTLDENEAEVMFDGGIHGDEIGAAENCIRFARDICREYGIDPDITDLIDNREIWIFYMVNPDGRVADSRTNANGVDLNRDSGYMWDSWGGSTGAFSQPESKALRDCHYNRQFVVHTTYHSGTEYISCPWSYRADQCPDLSHILQLAGEYSSSSGYANMEYGQGCTGMYPINGSTKDTNYGMMGAISWSMEISYDKDPPTSQIMMFYNYNRPAMLSMIEHSGYGLEGVVSNANTGEIVTANVFINDYFPCYTDPVVGDYHKYVLPGTYDITVVANGYETQTITGISVVSGNATVTNFQLQPLDGQFVYKISASRIPGNNTVDEGDTSGVIGAPDNRNYSIGKDGWIIVDMQYPILDGAGNDLIVYEGDTSAEGYSVYGGETIDGSWFSLGDGNGTTEFDLADGNLIEAQFIKIVDDGDGAAIAANAGFDLDAVEAISEVSGVYIAFLGYELDEMVGNNNGYIDPGETMDMLVSIRNNGDELALDVNGVLSTNSGFVTMNNGDLDFGNLDPGETAFGIFTFTVAMATPIGELLTFDLEIEANAGTYVTNFNIACQVGIAIEDFESNNFQNFDWEFGGNTDWTISTDAYEGSYCAKSGTINNNQSTSLILATEVIADGDISFYRKVSSEENWDFLHFYIDNSEMSSWSGTSGWVEEVYPVTAGTHTFKWEYTKDGSVSNGSDCGWVDYIVFPPINTGEYFGTVQGTVTDADTGLPIEGVNIGGFAITNVDGWYTFDIEVGIYDYTCSAENYFDVLLESVIVYENQVTTVDFEMQSTYPPVNLTAEIVDYNSSIIISWDAQTRSKFKNNDRDLLGYVVRLNGSMVGNMVESPFEIIGPFAPDEYLIEVNAIYDEGISAPAEITVTIVLNPPLNVTAQSQPPNIIITWDAPVRGIESYNIYSSGELIEENVMESPYIDLNVPTGTYIYNVTAVYDGGWESDPSIETEYVYHTTGDNILKPTVTELVGNYPNPFNPVTTIGYSIKNAGNVTLEVYNLKGQLVKTLVNKHLEAAFHDVVWNGKDNNNKIISSGIYFYKMKAGKYVNTKKMILMK